MTITSFFKNVSRLGVGEGTRSLPVAEKTPTAPGSYRARTVSKLDPGSETKGAIPSLVQQSVKPLAVEVFFTNAHCKSIRMIFIRLLYYYYFFCSGLPIEGTLTRFGGHDWPME